MPISPLEERHLRQLLTDGASFKTTGRNGKTKSRVLWCSKDLDTIYCSESKKAWRPKEIKTDSASVVCDNDSDCIFSIITPKKRFQLQAEDTEQKKIWMCSLRKITELRSPTTSAPFNVQHITHVDRNLEWTGDLSEIFVLEELLGEGSFGSVYKARHRDSGVTMAVKLVVAENFTEIAHEIEILKLCSHTNIVSYYGCWGPDPDGRIWILMDYCNAGDACGLAELTNTQLPEPLVRYILLCAVRSLLYLHAKKIIHRDVKGGNILLTSAGDVKLADFGVSKQIQATIAKGGVNELAGSPLWMAPEVLRGRTAAYNSDVWSLGITAIELAEGAPPRSNMTAYQVMKAVIREEPPQLTSRRWSNELRDFVGTCLVKDPEDRPSALELASHRFLALSGADELKLKNALRTFLTRNRKPKRSRTSIGSKLSVIAHRALQKSSSVQKSVGPTPIVVEQVQYPFPHALSQTGPESDAFVKESAEPEPEDESTAFDTTVIRTSDDSTPAPNFLLSLRKKPTAATEEEEEEETVQSPTDLWTATEEDAEALVVAPQAEKEAPAAAAVVGWTILVPAVVVAAIAWFVWRAL